MFVSTSQRASASVNIKTLYYASHHVDHYIQVVLLRLDKKKLSININMLREEKIYISGNYIDTLIFEDISFHCPTWGLWIDFKLLYPIP